MSMRENAMIEYGIVIDREMAKTIAFKICAEDFANCENPAAAFSDAFSADYWHYFGVVEDKLGLLYCGEFTGEAFRIMPDGDPCWSDAVRFDNEPIYIMTLWKYPSLCRAAYDGFDEIVSECSDKLGDYLPDDFDYASKIRVVIGTYWG